MERTKEEVEQTRLVCCATPPTKIAKKTGSRCTRIYRRALRRDNLSTTQERSFSYPQWGRTVNNKQETRKRLFGVRLFKKKSKKESLGSIEWRLYCRLVQEKSTKNKKVKPHRVAVCCGQTYPRPCRAGSCVWEFRATRPRRATVSKNPTTIPTTSRRV